MRRRRLSPDPETALVEAIVACANVRITVVVLSRDEPVLLRPGDSDSFATFESLLRDHPWAQFEQRAVDVNLSRHVEPAQFPEGFRVFMEHGFLRKMLEELIRDPIEFRLKYAELLSKWFGRRFVDLMSLWTAESDDLIPDEPRTCTAVLNLSYERRRGFRLELRPVLATIPEALLYGLGLLLDERRGFGRTLGLCHSPRVRGNECGRFFFRSVVRQHFCSKGCARRAAKEANVRRQQRFRHQRGIQ